MKWKQLLSVLIITAILSPLVIADERDCVYYFYGKDCTHCGEIDQKLSLLKVKYPNIEIHPFEVYFEPKNVELLNQFFTSYNVPPQAQGLPALFMPNTYLIGNKSIQELLEGRILNNKDPTCPTFEQSTVIGVTGEKSPHDVLDTLTLGKVTTNALKDSIRPASLAMILIFLALLIALKEEKKILLWGIVFIAIAYFLYFLYTMGYLSFLSTGNTAQTIFTKMIAVISLISGILVMYGFINRTKAVSRYIPEEKRSQLQVLYKYATHPVSIVLIAIITTAITIANASDIFNIIHVLFSKTPGRTGLIILLTYYIFIMIIPLLLVLWIIYKAVKHLKHHALNKEPYSDMLIEKWVKHNYKILAFCGAVALFLGGIIILLL